MDPRGQTTSNTQKSLISGRAAPANVLKALLDIGSSGSNTASPASRSRTLTAHSCCKGNPRPQTIRSKVLCSDDWCASLQSLAPIRRIWDWGCGLQTSDSTKRCLSLNPRMLNATSSCSSPRPNLPKEGGAQAYGDRVVAAIEEVQCQLLRLRRQRIQGWLAACEATREASNCPRNRRPETVVVGSFLLAGSFLNCSFRQVQSVKFRSSRRSDSLGCFPKP